MLGIAYQHAETTESLPEVPAPADLGGYMLHIDLHKIVANAGGMYIEIDTSANHHYDATGLIRVHKEGFNPQLGPSDSLVRLPYYSRPHLGPRETTGIGAAWKVNGTWHKVGELTNVSVNVTDVIETPELVSFKVYYNSSQKIIEHYVVTPSSVTLTTDVVGYSGPLRYIWPMLADNGKEKTVITLVGGTVHVRLNNTIQTFYPVGASTIHVADTLYPNRNGWAKIAVAQYPHGGKITMEITPMINRNE
jgi:hypothetical protein